MFANLGAFAVIITVSQVSKSEELEDHNSLNRRSPFLAAAILLFQLSLAGFIGEIYLFVAAMNQELYMLLIVGFINIVISMYYYLIVKKMYINEPTDPSAISTSWPIKVAVYAGIAVTLLLGIYAGPFIH